MSSMVSPAASGLPDIDDRLVEPETRYEMLDGELVYVCPADRPHGRRHAKVIALLETHAFAEFEVGCDQLTRTSEVDDVAPDASVYLSAPDPGTGGRQLEQLAFEVVSTESLGHAGSKAAKLTTRGVRRVFAIDIERSRVLEWSAELGTWRGLDAAGHIEDAALELALPIEAMLHAARADDALAHALVARRNPVIEAVRAEDRAAGKAEGVQEGFQEGFLRGKAEAVQEGFLRGKAEGVQEGFLRGKAEAVLAVLAARNAAVGEAQRVRILGERDPAQLDRWLAEAATCAEVAELFTIPRDRG
jgi:Uma2 family endonuclease